MSKEGSIEHDALKLVRADAAKKKRRHNESRHSRL